MARPVSLIVDIGFATMNVPSEAPPMMTNSQGCQITERCPPIAAKPPRMQPRAMTIPMTKPTRSAPARIPCKSLTGRPCSKLNWKAQLIANAVKFTMLGRISSPGLPQMGGTVLIHRIAASLARPGKLHLRKSGTHSEARAMLNATSITMQ